MSRACRALSIAALATLLLPASALAQTSGEAAPAGGAETAQIAIASGVATLLTLALLALGLGHRSGRVPLLGRAARTAAAIARLPTWAALPVAIAAGSLLCAVFGLYWDVSLHIDNGRDPGPLANPSHYFILAGLFGIFSAGWFAIVLPEGKPSSTSVHIGRDWDAPVGGLLMMACATFALIGFPLDDVSHRLFGQDVTLWGPTHLMMLGGAAMTLIAILALMAEARLAVARTATVPPSGLLSRLASETQVRALRAVAATGGLLIGLSIFQGEFDFGVPQFRMLYQPVLIALAAGVALVCARTIAGRGAAFGAVGFFLLVRGVLTVVVGPGFGESISHFPLYVVEALLVELVALRVSPRRRPYRFGLIAGALIGTVGVLAEWGWSHVWMPMPWPDHLVPQAIAVALPVALAAGVLGAFVGSALQLRAEHVRPRRVRLGALASLLAIAGVIAGLAISGTPEGRAVVTLREIGSGPDRVATAIVRVDPPSLARDADWVGQISWQGRERLRVDSLQRIADGVYRTRQPLPITGDWKSYIRLQRGSTLAAVPVFLPADPAIPAAGVPALQRFERPFQPDRELLQRERKDDVPTWLWAAAGLVVLAIAATLIALIAWTLLRIGGAPPSPREAPRRERSRVPVSA